MGRLADPNFRTRGGRKDHRPARCRKRLKTLEIVVAGAGATMEHQNRELVIWDMVAIARDPISGAKATKRNKPSITGISGIGSSSFRGSFRISSVLDCTGHGKAAYDACILVRCIRERISPYDGFVLNPGRVGCPLGVA